MHVPLVVGCSNGFQFSIFHAPRDNAAMMQCRALFLHLLKALHDDEWCHRLRKGNGYLAVEMLHHYIDCPKLHPGRCRLTGLIYPTFTRWGEVRHPYSHPPFMPALRLHFDTNNTESDANWRSTLCDSEFKTSNLTKKTSGRVDQQQ